MKKLFALLFLLSISYSFYNCSSDDNDGIPFEEDKTITCKSFDRIMNRLYKGSPSDGWTLVSPDSVVVDVPSASLLYQHGNSDYFITFFGNKDSLITNLPLVLNGTSSEFPSKCKYKFENQYLRVWKDIEKEWITIGRGSKEKISFTHEFVQASGSGFELGVPIVTIYVNNIPDAQKEQIDKLNVASLNSQLDPNSNIPFIQSYFNYSNYDKSRMLWYMYTYNLE